MTPDERARSTMESILDETMSRHATIEAMFEARIARLAAAIRAAENDALERAAKLMVASKGSLKMWDDAARDIRALKHPCDRKEEVEWLTFWTS